MTNKILRFKSIEKNGSILTIEVHNKVSDIVKIENQFVIRNFLIDKPEWRIYHPIFQKNLPHLSFY